MSEVLPRRRVVKDPVHDYVDIPGELVSLVSSPAIQRLRNIGQNARVSIRYPASTGSRFEHAPGTMHLAIAARHSAWRNCSPMHGDDPDRTRAEFAGEVIADLMHAQDLDACTAEWVAPHGGGEPADTPLWHDFPRVIGVAIGATGASKSTPAASTPRNPTPSNPPIRLVV